MAQDVFWLLVEVFGFLFGVCALMPIMAIFIGAWMRIPMFLHMRRKGFFFVYIRKPPDNLERIVVLNKEVKHDQGKIPYVEIDKGKYNIDTKFFFRSGIDPAIEYVQGRPNPVMRFPRTKEDESDSGFTSEEERDSYNTKMFQDLLRYNYTNLDYMIIMLLIVNMVVGAIGAFYAFDSMNALGQILSALHSLLPKGVTG